MHKPKLDRAPTCGVSIALEVLGGKWKACLIHGIRNGQRRPSELHCLNSTAPPRVLNQQLNELVAHGMVRKVIYPVLPPKAEYFLTSQGESLLAIVDAMEAWGTSHGGELWTQLATGADHNQLGRP